MCASALQKSLAFMFYVVAFWHHTGTYHVFASVLIFSRWRVKLAAGARKLLCKDSLVLAHTHLLQEILLSKGQAWMGLCLLSPKALHGFIRRYGQGRSHSYG